MSTRCSKKRYGKTTISRNSVEFELLRAEKGRRMDAVACEDS